MAESTCPPPSSPCSGLSSSHLGAPSANVPPFRSMQNPWGWTINIININILEVFVEVIDGRTDGQRTYNFGVPCGLTKQKSIFALHAYNNYTTINSRYFNPLEVSKSLNRPYDVDFATLVYNVNPGLINPKRLFNWGGYHLCIILYIL